MFYSLYKLSHNTTSCFVNGLAINGDYQTDPTLISEDLRQAAVREQVQTKQKRGIMWCYSRMTITGKLVPLYYENVEKQKKYIPECYLFKEV